MAQHLSPRVRRIVRALIEAVKPRKPGFDPPVEEEMLEFADTFYSYFPWHMKVGLPLGLYLLEFGPLIFQGSLLPFSRMKLDDRDRYLQGWVDSKIGLRRDLVKGMKALCLPAYYSNPEVMAHIGFDLEAHLRKVNGVGQPSEPASAEACAFFRKMGYDNNPRIPYPGRDAFKPGRQAR